MNFEYSEEQNLLKESIVRWAQDNYSFDQRRLGAESDNGFSQEHYNTFAELGWLSVPFSEDNGGYGGSVVDVAAIMEEFGRALVVEPVFPNLILFGGLLEHSTNESVKAELIPQVIDGSLMGAVALYEPHARFDSSNIATTATKTGDAYSLNGHKSVVLGGAHAQKLIVVARTSGDQTDEDGLSLFLIDADAAGVVLNTYPLMDGQQVADVHLNDASAVLISELDSASSVVNKVLSLAHVALCAEAVGIMDVLNRTTVEYTKTRKQFGVTISSFQALQHRMVDTFMSYEQAKSLLVGTLVELVDQNTSPERTSKMVNALRTLVAKNGKHIGDEAIQLHGGMGMKTIDDVKVVMVAGAGTLGLRIALRCAFDGYRVKMFDISECQLESAQTIQAKLIRSFLASGTVTQQQVDFANANIVCTTDIDEAVKDVDLVSESVIENIDIKKQFYADLTPRLAKGVILTTNTSYLLPSDLLGSIQEPELFCALHFHDVFRQIVVDVMPHPHTNQAVIDLLMEFGKRINHVPVFVKKESSGYMFNAMLMSILSQASDLLANDIGSFQDIDRSFMANFGTIAGPFGMMDQVGLDTVWHIVSSRDEPRFKAFANIIKLYIDQGKLGHKSGEGFYTYPGPEFAQLNFLKA